MDTTQFHTQYAASMAAFLSQLPDPGLRIAVRQQGDPFFRQCALAVWQAGGTPLSPAHTAWYNALYSGSVRPPDVLFWALTAIFSRIWFVRLGYNAGVSSIKFIGDNAAYISKAAGILGVMVVGGLIPSYVSFAFPETLVISSVSVQGIFDSIMPNILPLGFVFLLYWLFKKKNVNTMKLILLVIALSVALSFLGIM